MKSLVLFLLNLYKRLLSPTFTIIFGHACRYTPTCSEYSIKAIETYGVWKGSLLSLKRVTRCNPLHEPGYDPLI